jgi:hypothetical protein
MQVNQRLAASVRKDFYLSPAYAAHPGTKSLHGGFLRGEANGQLADAAAAVSDFQGREDSLQEALGVPVEGFLHAVDLDGIDPGSESDHRIRF